MEAFISGYELIGEGESGHKWSFFEPEDGTKWSWEEDALYSSKGNQPFLESSLPVHPLHGPLCLLANNVNVSDGAKEVVLLIQILDVSVDEEGVGLGVDVLHGNLEAIEAPGLRYLNFRAELLG